MRRAAVLGVSAVLLSGCALPIPLQIASWALDGVSVLVSQKSITDHGISLITQKDCAIWRGITGDELCRDIEDTDVLVAENVINSSNEADATETETLAITSLASQPSASPSKSPTYRVRAVPTHALRAAWADKAKPSVSAPKVFISNAHALRARQSTQPIHQAKVVAVVEQPLVTSPDRLASLSVTAVTKSPKHQNVKDAQPSKGVYFVIGSFRNPDNAKRLVRGHVDLSPAVLRARLDGTDVYRVVVGPVPRGREKRLHRALARDGFSDTWAIRVNPLDWRFAKLREPRSKAVVEVATLQN